MDDVRLVATDLDRTLLLSGGKLPPNFWDYVRRLNDAGVLVVPASGRPLPTLREMFSRPGYDIALISDNGAVVEQGGEIVHRSLMAPEDYLAMVELTQNETDGVPLVVGVDHGYLPTSARHLEDHLSMFFRNLVFTDDFSKIDEDVVKFSAFFPEADAQEAFDNHFTPAFGDTHSVTLGGPPWVDVMNAGVTKGEGLEMLASRLGLEKSQLMAFGDALNDVEMLASAGHSYAVANAVPEVLEQAEHTTASNEDLGVLQVWDQLLDSKES